MKYQAENTVSSFFYYMWNAWSKDCLLYTSDAADEL